MMTEDQRMHAACQWAKNTHPEFAALLASVNRTRKPAMHQVNLPVAMPLTMAGPTKTGGTLRLMLHNQMITARRIEHGTSSGVALPLPPDLHKPQPA